MTFIPVSNYDSNLLKGSKLLLPTVSIGNVPQLTFDLLVHTFKLQRVGYIDQDTLMPVSGIREDDKTGVTVPMEVFQSKDHQWTYVQQRSPTIKGKRQAFLDQLVQFASQFSQVIIVTSMDASRRLDSQIRGGPFRVFGDKSVVDQLGIPVLENMLNEDLPAAGLARHLYQQLSSSLPTSLLVMFALEGDNVQDSIEYAHLINTVFKLQTDISSWTPPKSWEFLFGTPFNAELYQ
ncbi:Proteasome assembly chaperone 2 [Choanephora cucurbitarum]|uniref:Proteasome assembly chaperone 2 n=1 Tax=Choanephora cucurbitarum TaxID=101091 RepID=A0A1C7MYT0_9FUNG|nr:Proteasome assembly chaperone 2 [Choanephora cucurbitarum]